MPKIHLSGLIYRFILIKRFIYPEPVMPLCPPSSSARIDLVLIGTRGQVGSAFRQQLAAQQAALGARAGLDLRLLATFDRRGLAFDLEGLDPATAEVRLHPYGEAEREALFARLREPAATPTVVVDCTAAEAIADRYPEWLASGVGIATANKRANARPLAFYRRLRQLARTHGAPYRFETTVGAAIPLLGPLQEIVLRGEQVHSVQGVLSGSLSFLLERLHAGEAFSTALAEARRLGYTEPDPFEDLRAEDLARKLLVLARVAGFELENAALEVEPFCVTPPPLDPADEAAFLAAEDRRWRTAIEAALVAGERYVMLAEVGSAGARVGLRRLPAQHPFAALPAGQNLVRIETELQRERPLWLGGPGAGPAITAAGVLGDVIAAASELRDRRYANRRFSVAA